MAKKKAAAKPDHTPKYTFRFTDETIAQLADLSRANYGASRTAILVQLVAERHAQTFGKKSRKNSADVS